jgi:hypothetical protein
MTPEKPYRLDDQGGHRVVAYRNHVELETALAEWGKRR